MSLDAALRLAEHFVVFPILDKVPCISGWADGAASRDPEQIKRWWTLWPDANPAILMGYGLFAVDADLKDGGPAALMNLQFTHAPLPPTRRVRTGGGGSHHLFWVPDAYKDADGTSAFVNSTSKLGPGIDIKTSRGFVVGAGSRHKSGALYEWVDESVPIEQAPEWLMRLLMELTPRAKASPERAERTSVHELPLDAGLVDLIAPFWEEPHRHTLAMALGGFLCRAGYEIEEVEDLIRDICDHVGNPNAELRCKDARDSCHRLDQGGTVTGGPAIREIVGAEIFERICALVFAEQREAEAKERADFMAVFAPSTSPSDAKSPPEEKSVDMGTLKAAIARLSKKWAEEGDERSVGLASVMAGQPVEPKMLAKVVWMIGWIAPSHSTEVLDRHLLHRTLIAMKLTDEQRKDCVEYLQEQFVAGQDKKKSKVTQKQVAAHERRETKTKHYSQQRKTPRPV